MNKTLVKISAILSALSIILGAFGAHALKVRLSESSLASYKTGVLYMLICSLAMFALALFDQIKPDVKVIRTSFWMLLAGIVLFSGSIFLLSTQTITGINFSWLGPVTPIGGLFMIIGWLNLARY